MAFGANSKIFTAYLHDVLANTSAADIDTDALIEAALFDNTITPLQTDTAAHAAYAGAGGPWASGGVVDTGTSAPAGWPALGRPLAWGTATRWSVATATPLVMDSDDTVSANAVTTLTNAYGCLIYDHTAGTPTDEGFCYLSFGGANSVTLGTFTLVWNAAGVMSFAL
jgi:hypothetical protein